VDAAGAHVHAIDDGISKRPAALDDPPVQQWRRQRPPTPTRRPTSALSDLLRRSPPHGWSFATLQSFPRRRSTRPRATSTSTGQASRNKADLSTRQTDAGGLGGSAASRAPGRQSRSSPPSVACPSMARRITCRICAFDRNRSWLTMPQPCFEASMTCNAAVFVTRRSPSTQPTASRLLVGLRVATGGTILLALLAWCGRR
jgi:hypothetical protein